MKVFGISMVRNEADIIETNVRYHLSLGLDRLLIVDNGSTDGTDRVLERLARDRRVQWTRDSGPYNQSETLTQLAREAFKEGANWIVPFDGDEFIHPCRGGIKDILSRSEAGALCVQLVSYIQRRDQIQASPAALLQMTRRIDQPVGPLDRLQELVESRQIAYVEMMYPPKWISRASAEIEISTDNHFVSGVRGHRENTEEIAILHAPLRARSILESKADQGYRIEEAGWGPGAGWHMLRFTRLKRDSGLETEWAANSYHDGSLNVYGVAHPVVHDPTLRDAISPFVPSTSWRQSVWNTLHELISRG